MRLGGMSVTTESVSTTTAAELNCCSHHVLGQVPRLVRHSIITFRSEIKNCLLKNSDRLYSNHYNTKPILIIITLFHIRLAVTEKHDFPL